jgi:hypothetical protein
VKTALNGLLIGLLFALIVKSDMVEVLEIGLTGCVFYGMISSGIADAINELV